MSSVEIRSLLQPPNPQESDAHALAYLNETYKSVDDLEHGTDLDVLVEQTRERLEGLESNVRLLPTVCVWSTSHRTLPQLSSRTRKLHWTL